MLAWFGGVSLFFVTLIFPIEFRHEWLTISWALEGMALCWLYRKIPNHGLRLAGVGLLCAVVARLALNSAVLAYHARSATPIFNWFLYTYGVAALCFFVAAWLLNPPRHLLRGFDLRWLLCPCGGLLIFLLINIEIADYFTKPGAVTLTLDFSENLGRDMSFSIAWALFALILLLLGIAKNLRVVRYASLALLGVTLLKLFFHDLSQLGQLYRIGALVIVAIIALVMSFLYQRFFAAKNKSESAAKN